MISQASISAIEKQPSILLVNKLSPFSSKPISKTSHSADDVNFPGSLNEEYYAPAKYVLFIINPFEKSGNFSANSEIDIFSSIFF